MPDDDKVLHKKKPVADVVVTRRSTSTDPLTWLWPTTSRSVSQEPSRTHNAIDISGRRGDPIFAPTSGRISAILWQPSGYGRNVRIDTASGYTIILGHMDALIRGLSVGQEVTRGQLLGLMGSTGLSTGPHVHVEVRRRGTPDSFAQGTTSAIGAIDPRPLFGASPQTQPRGVLPQARNFEWAPVTGATVATAPLLSMNPYPGIAAGFNMATGQAPATVNITQRAPYPGIAPGGVAAATGSQPGDIRIASTPLGPITIPKVGQTGIRVIVIVVAVLVGIGTLLYIARGPVNATAGAVAEAGAKASGIPGAATGVRKLRGLSK